MRVVWRGKVWAVRVGGGKVAVGPEAGPSRTFEIPAEADVEVVRDRTGTWVWADGVVAHLQPAGASGAAGGAGEIRSPMTGTLVSVSVKPGDAVKAGAPLATVAAMKMEFRIEATADGVVKEVAAKAGDRVDLGDVLVRMA
jgi:biotin carboxyl carrier protein